MKRPMQLDVVNSKNEKVGALDVRDEVFGGRVNADLIWESVVRANAAEAARHARDEEPRARQRQRQEAVAAEGHRPRARRRDPQPAVAPGRHGVRAAAAQLRLQLPKKVERGALRAALAQKLQDGAARRRRRARGGRDQDEGGGRDAEAARRRRQGACSSTSRPTRSWRGRCATSPAWRSCRARA